MIAFFRKIFSWLLVLFPSRGLYERSSQTAVLMGNGMGRRNYEERKVDPQRLEELIGRLGEAGVPNSENDPLTIKMILLGKASILKTNRSINDIVNQCGDDTLKILKCAFASKVLLGKYEDVLGKKDDARDMSEAFEAILKEPVKLPAEF